MKLSVMICDISDEEEDDDKVKSKKAAPTCSIASTFQSLIRTRVLPLEMELIHNFLLNGMST